MAEINYKLRSVLQKLKEQLWELRGELPQCRSCPMHLTCFMKRYPLFTDDVFWCLNCDGWTLPHLKLILCCNGYRVRQYQDQRYSAMLQRNGTCRNCNRLCDEYQTYTKVKLRHVSEQILMVEEGIEREDLAEKVKEPMVILPRKDAKY